MKPLPLCVPALLALGTIFTLYLSADALMRELPLPTHLRACYQKAQTYTCQNYVGGQYCWYCESPLRAYVRGSSTPLTHQQTEYINRLYRAAESSVNHLGRGKRQAAGQRQKCLRKECRILTDAERNRLFAAFNALKADTSVEPNMYDAIALYHTGVTNFLAHGGPGFIGWHRVYLAILEEALRQMDPDVCLCYWDSSLDSELADPVSSNVWSDAFFGDSQGAVTTGPFANWITRNNVPLTRSVGVDGQPMSRRVIEDILSRTTYEEILLSDRDPQYNLEFHHGAPHIFVGGDMERLETAPNDPVFFLHHTFIDYIWDLFRTKMRSNGLNPEVYPSSPTINDLHLPGMLMGFGNITHQDGYLEVWKESFDYQPSPTCSRASPNCGSRYLTCDVARSRCVPVNPQDTGSTTPPPTPSPTPSSTLRPTPGTTPSPAPSTTPSPTPSHNSSCTYKPQAYQNSFCVDGQCDVRQWVWLPVKIVSQRPPEFTEYKSYPVQNSRIYTASDIYEPTAYSETSRYINTTKPHPKSYEHCEVKDGVGKIFLSSMGLSYDGYYKESAIIDQRLTTAVSIAYIAVKDPGTGSSEVILRARDQCGRICRSACRVPGSNPARYQKCSGVVEVNSQAPKMYAQTYAAATLMAYDYASDAYCPNVNLNDFFITFYCDYIDYLPWIDRPTQTFPGPAPTVNTYQPQPVRNQCRVSSQCVIKLPCFVDPLGQGRTCSDYSQIQSCVNNCTQYVVCNYGSYWLRYFT